MATSPEVNYPHVQNYIVKFSWSAEPSYLILVYNVNRRFQFVDLKTGRLFNCEFEDVPFAYQWLCTVSKILEENVIETTYIP